MDGIVAGEGEGPLAPRSRPLGAVLAATDPIALDLAALQLMGFEFASIPKVREAIADPVLSITAVRTPGDVAVIEADSGGLRLRERQLEELGADESFLAHPGWQGHVEVSPCAA